MKMKHSWLFLVFGLVTFFSFNCYGQDTWTQRNPFPGKDLHSILWTGTQLIAVGNVGTVLTSPDGSAWIPRTTGTNFNLKSIAWTGALYVAVGGSSVGAGSYSGVILTSPDGITWTIRSTAETPYLDDITWTGTQFVTVGNSGAILTSPDGITWTKRTSNYTKDFFSITWTGTKLAAVGGSGSFFSSSDGVAWDKTDFTQYQNFSYITWVRSQYLAIGGFTVFDRETNQTVSSEFFATSPDGLTWTRRRYLNPILTSYNFTFATAWTGSQLVAVGLNGGILTSSDFTTWTQKNTGTPSALYAVTWTGTQLVAVGKDGIILTSPESPVRNNSRPLQPQIEPILRFASASLLITLPSSLRDPETRATIHDLTGHKVWEGAGSSPQGELAVPTTGFPKGRYLLEVRGAGERISKPFCILR
jgi:hypothetical protein